MTRLARWYETLPLAALCFVISACGETARLSVDEVSGTNPKLVPPNHTLIPTVVVATAKGWPAGVTPIAAPGLRVNAFADGLKHPRWIYVLENGDVLVAETNAPPRPEEGKGIKAFFMRIFMKRAGAAVPSANRITLLRDRDGDGVAETRSVFASGLSSPFGMAQIGDDFYVANADSVVRFHSTRDAQQLSGSAEKIADLPGGPINHHWTKNILADPNGTGLFVTVGSNSNAAERGIANEENRAAILYLDLKSGALRPFATGLRNPVGLAWYGDQLYTVVNERDELGSDLVPDYLTAVHEGAFYGWPYSYYGQNVDARVKPQRPDLVARAVKPDFALGPHTASLGLAFNSGALFPQHYRNGAFVGQHGSWNRRPPSGYKVIFVPFDDGKPVGPMEDVLTGFLDDAGNARGRPVGVAFDKRGALLVADDVGNTVWRVVPEK